jgi:hypothetical protein
MSAGAEVRDGQSFQDWMEAGRVRVEQALERRFRRRR